MLSEEEKSRIIEQVTFEAEVRKRLSPDKPQKKPWWESSLFLLLAGSLVTALFVPWFQSRQRSLDWQRQNRYDTNNFRLQTMRDCLRETVILHTFPAEAYERFRRALQKDASTSDVAAFSKEFVELQNRRFQQNAKTASSILYFPKNETVRNIFQSYIDESSIYFRAIELNASNCEARPKTCPRADSSSLDEELMKVDSLYEGLTTEIKDEISSQEQENEKFRL